jgi:hypothetical protein
MDGSIINTFHLRLKSAAAEPYFGCGTGSAQGASILYFFWNFNRNHTENDRYWQKNRFLLFAKCLKMYSFFRFCILRLQKVLL